MRGAWKYVFAGAVAVGMAFLPARSAQQEVASAPVAADHRHEPYQRVAEDAKTGGLSLEMAIREFRSQVKGRPTVYLAAAVHIGEQSFYDALQAFLDKQDVVLFEGVKPPGAGDAEHDGPGELSDAEKLKATKQRVRFLAMAVEQYRAQEGELPGSLEDIRERGGRIASLVGTAIRDAWGRELTYVVELSEAGKPVSFDVLSLGADGKPGGEGIDADLRFKDQKPLKKAEAGDRSGGIQTMLAKSLGVVFQLDAMDHDGANWRNSDMSVDQVQSRLEQAGASGDSLFSALDGSSMMGRVAGALLGFLSATPESRTMLRLMMIEMLGRADELLSGGGLPGGMDALMKVILEDRNKVVMADLRKVIEAEPDVKTVGIIYGAGHLPGIERDLVAMGYAPVGDSWNAAMRADAAGANMTQAQFQQMRKTMSRMIENQFRQMERMRSRKKTE